MRLPWDEAGQGSAVVLLHARPADRTMWRAHLPLLADAGYRALALDLPGHGQAVVDGRHRLAPWTDVLQTLTDLGVDRFVLVGNSLGALAGLQVAVSAQERVRGLVLVGYRSHDQPASPKLQAAWDAERAALAAGDVQRAVDAGVRAWLSPDAPVEVTKHAAQMLRRSIELQLAAGEVAQAEDPLDQSTAVLDDLALPATVGVGELDMPDFFRGGEELARRLGAGPLFVVPGAGHLAPLEQPVLFTQQILDFASALSHETA